MSDIPHLRLPFRITPRGAVTVEQDTDADVTQCVTALARLRRGHITYDQSLGVTDPTFTNIVDATQVADEIREHEPRFAGAVELTVVNPSTQTVTVTVALKD